MALTKVTQHSLGNSAVTTAKLGTAPFGFANSSANVVYMAANGNVGIGTSTPGYRLQIKGESVGITSGDGTVTNLMDYATIGTITASNFAITSNNVTRLNITANGAVQIKSTTAATPTYSFTNNGEGLLFRYNDDAGVRAADIVAIGNTPAGAAMNIRFFTNPVGTDAASERMRINTYGYTYVNTISALSPDNAWFSVKSTESSNIPAVTILGSTGPWAMKVGTVDTTSTRYIIGVCNNSGATIGGITTNGSTTAYNTNSDYRLKKNITPLTGALGIVAQLKPSVFTWKESNIDSQGFIAHELQEVLPGAVIGIKDAIEADGSVKPQMVDTSFLVATLTAAIQELKAEFDAYRASHP